MSARESSGVASLTSARRRRENRLLSLGTLIIAHANESVDSRARLLQTYARYVRKQRRRGFAASVKRSKKLPMGRDWLSRLSGVTGTLISVALIKQLTLISLYDSLTACRYSSLIIYGFLDPSYRVTMPDDENLAVILFIIHVEVNGFSCLRSRNRTVEIP